MIRRLRAAYAGRTQPAALRNVPGLVVTDRVLEVVALIFMVVAAFPSFDDTNNLALVLLVPAGWAPLLVRHRWPVLALFAVVAVEGIHLFAVELVAPVEFNSIPIATMVACYSLAMQRDRWTAWICGGAAALVLLALGTIARPGDQLAANMFALDLVLVATAVGVLIRGRYLRLEAMERRAVQAEEAAEEEARRQVADERLRMARELHDVIAHNLALVNAQSGVAEYLIHTDPEAAAKALKNLTEHTRQALDELRATVGLLRQDTDGGEEAQRVPMPGLVDLPTLIESHRSSGVDVTLTVIGEPLTLPALTDLAAYRIAQEAMTNARKHAPEAVVEVTLAWAPDELRLKVTNTASPVAPPEHRGDGTGHGILGMRERALAAHGDVDRRAPARRRVPRARPAARSTPRSPHDDPRVARRRPGAAAVDVQAAARVDARHDRGRRGIDRRRGRRAGPLARADLVLMDIRMPDMDGIEATRLITEDDALDGVRILILTTFETDELVVDALRAGASGYLGKGVDPATLLDAIRTVASGESLLSSAATTALIQRFLSQPTARLDAKLPVIDALTAREREITTLVAAGLSNEQIAERLFISPSTAKTHVNRAMMKVGARDRAQLVVFAYENGLVEPGRQPS